MRVDENTKEILQTWPLTRVRRWAATANLFTLVGLVCEHNLSTCYRLPSLIPAFLITDSLGRLLPGELKRKEPNLLCTWIFMDA